MQFKIKSIVRFSDWTYSLKENEFMTWFIKYDDSVRVLRAMKAVADGSNDPFDPRQIPLVVPTWESIGELSKDAQHDLLEAVSAYLESNTAANYQRLWDLMTEPMPGFNRV
jgi:hypothetical protein